MYLVTKQFVIGILIICVCSGFAIGACPLGDLDGDCRVGVEDLALLAGDWLSPSAGALGDLDGLYSEGIYVNMADFSVLAENWLEVGSLLYITEFMASNDSKLGTRVDNLTVYPDWIEIHNPTTGAVDLTGWSLTDSDGDLDKWQFPNGEELDPGEYLVVFASGNAQPENTGQYPYVDSDGNYHTNFSLDADGGSKYLAIVMPDGVTISHEYDGYPDQYTDISYGLVNEVLVGDETAMAYHVPADDTDESIWMTEGYDSDSWSSGTGGVGFGVTVVTGSEMIIFDDVSDLDLLGTVKYAINCGSDQNFTVGTVDFRGDVYQWQPSDINGDGTINWHDNLYNAYCPGKSDPSPSIAGVTVQCSDSDTNGMDHGPYEGKHDNNNTDGLFSGDGSNDATNLKTILGVSGMQNIGYYNGTEGERDMIFDFAVTAGKVYKVQLLLYKKYRRSYRYAYCF